MESAEDSREIMVRNSLWPIWLSAAPGPIAKLSKTMAFSEKLQQKLMTSVDNQIPILPLVLVELHAVVTKVTLQLEIAIAQNGQRDQLSAQYSHSLLTKDTGWDNILEPGGLQLRMDILALPEFQLWWKKEEEEKEAKAKKEAKEVKEVNAEAEEESKWGTIAEAAVKAEAKAKAAKVPEVATKKAAGVPKATTKKVEAVEKAEEEEASKCSKSSSKIEQLTILIKVKA